jgi:ABC-type lipoprotein release transport system permease subunit
MLRSLSGRTAVFVILLAAAALLAAFAAFAAPTPTDLPAVLLSRQLAEAASLRVGDTVTLAADADGAAARQFRLAGIYEPTPDPMRFTTRRLEARLHLPDLNALTAQHGSGQAASGNDPASVETVNAINVRLADPNDAGTFASALHARAPGIVARPTARARDGSDPFAVLERFHLAVAIVTVLGSTAFLLALMVMRAEERRETVGIIRLIGVSQRFVLLVVLAEGLLIAAAGAVFGVLVAVAAEGAVNRFFQWRYDTALVFVRVTLTIALQSIALAVPLGIVAGLVGSWTLLRRDIVSLIRR